MARVEFADPLGNAVSGFVEGRKMRLAEQQVMYDTVVAPAMRFKEMILDAQLKAGLMGLRGGGGHGGGGGGGGGGGVGTSIYGPGGAPNPAAPLPQPTQDVATPQMSAETRNFLGTLSMGTPAPAPAYVPGPQPLGVNAYDAAALSPDYGTLVEPVYTAEANPLAESLRARTAGTAADMTRRVFGEPNPRDRALLEYLGYGG